MCFIFLLVWTEVVYSHYQLILALLSWNDFHFSKKRYFIKCLGCGSSYRDSHYFIGVLNIYRKDFANFLNNYILWIFQPKCPQWRAMECAGWRCSFRTSGIASPKRPSWSASTRSSPTSGPNSKVRFWSLTWTPSIIHRLNITTATKIQ